MSTSVQSIWLFRQFNIFVESQTLLFTFRALYLKKKLNVNLRYLYLSDYQIIARFWLMIYTFACLGASKRKFVESRQESHNCATSAKFK